MTPKPSGVGLQVANLIHSLYSLQAEENFELGIVYQPGIKDWLRGNWNIPEALTQYPSVHVLPIPVRVSNLLLFPTYKSIWSSLAKSWGNPDILHGTNYSVYPCDRGFKVMNIYDVAFIKYPQYVNAVAKSYAEKVKRCLRWTDLVLTISESSKQDIIQHLNVAAERVFVAPLASRYCSNYLSALNIEQLSQTANYDFSKPYLLFVSNIEPRKNIISIVMAFNELKQRYKIEHNLILIGRKGWNYQSIFAAIESSPYQQDIYHLDYLSDELVALFYVRADVFVYPSYYEGFGLPVLEAMTLGTPVVASNTSSLPEVTGDAAILIDPNDSNKLAEAIWEVINNSQLRYELIQKGKVRAKQYSWQHNARETLNAYRSLLV
ncbi:glycosyltransferase family 4 protein [Chroococcidiopsis sp. SAG 2025]|uniref:glycosyltransferase family 4 protein n=1 Tax=Chroococcidiopsis sp. SAG 2025 TaxID=171389 RepID=UPI0039777131